MKKKLIAIGVMCLLVLGFGAGYFALRGEEALPVYEGPRQLAHLFRYELPPLSVRLEGRDHQPFSLVRLALDPQRNVVSDSTIPGKEHLPLDTARISGVLGASRSLSILELVHESVEDYAPFGLENPRARVIFDFEALGAHTLLIGDLAPGNIGVYIRLEDSPAVYLSPVYTLDNFLRPYWDFLNMSITPLVGWPIAFDAMTLSGQVREEGAGEIVIVAGDDGEFMLDLPIQHDLSPIFGPGVIHSVFGLQAGGIAVVEPSAADLEVLGLDRPWASVTLSGAEGGDFTLHATQPDAGGMIFLYREGIPLIYTASAHDMHWLDIQFYQIMLPFAVSPSLEELYEVEIFLAQGRREGHILPPGIAEIEDGPQVILFYIHINEDGSGISVFVVGERISPGVDSDNFQRFFTTLTSASLEYLADPSHQPGQPVMTFTYRYRSGQERVVSFYPSDIPLRHYIRVDAGRLFLTPSLYLSRVFEDVWKVIANERVDAL